jgi:hypothetical protein
VRYKGTERIHSTGQRTSGAFQSWRHLFVFELRSPSSNITRIAEGYDRLLGPVKKEKSMTAIGTQRLREPQSKAVCLI